MGDATKRILSLAEKRPFVVTDALAHVRFLLRWSIVACVFKPSKTEVKSAARAHGMMFTLTAACNACLCE